MPTVSVIIPAYNSARFIGQTIDGVLAQTYGDYEIIVVDDGSTDATPDIVSHYDDPRLRYFRQDNQGATGAQNAGARQATGAYLVFSGADDRFLPCQLALQTRVLDERPEVGLVASGYQFVDENGRVLRERKPWVGSPAITFESVLFGGLAPPVALMLRRHWFERVGGFDPQLAYFEDTDLWYRLALDGCAMAWEPALVCQYRVHSSNMSRSPKVHFEYARKAVEKAFADPRLPDGLRARKGERLALLDLAEAARLLAGGWDGDARACIERAVELNPALLAEDARPLAEIAVGLRDDVFGDGRLPEFAAAVLEDKAPAFAGTLRDVSARKRFYTAYTDRDARAIREAWLDVARRDPRWLLNRGGWSILSQSLTGFRHA